MNSHADIHDLLWMSCINFGYHLSDVAPSSGQIFMSVTLVYDQIPAKLKTFPSASAVLHILY